MEKELFCAYHVGQNITNFCEDSQCLMPLCPKCLPIHTSEHKQNKTYGSFQPIDDMIQRATSISKSKIDSYKQILAKNERSSQNGSELQTYLIRQLKEAKEKVVFEIETFFNSLESKCQKLCTELTYKKSNNLKSETFDVEKKIRQYQEFLDGIQKKEKCLMSLIRIFKANKEDQLANNFELGHLNSSSEIPQNDLKKIQIKVDLEKLSEITDSLSGYVKLVYNQQQKVAKKQVKFDENSLSNKSVNSSQDISPIVFESPNSKIKTDKAKAIKRNTNNVYDKDQELEDEDTTSNNSQNNLQEKQQQQNKQKGFYKEADDIYLINDPDIIRLKQKQEERRIKNELREIGMKKITSNSNIPQSSKVRRPPNSIEDKLEEFNEPSNNFITFERPSKDQLKQFAKPEELEFLEKVQQKSIQLQQEFEKQQNEIFQSAINYQIPVPQRNVYQPRQFPEQKQLQFNSQQDLQQLPPVFKSHSASQSQSEVDISSPSGKQNLQNKYTTQQQVLQRSPLADRFDQNSFNRNPSEFINNQYENNFNRVQSPYSLKSQNMNSPNSKLVQNPINYDIQSNGYQAQQQWNNKKIFYN
ncbi:hypothetical protein TTHERM_00328640 (macronuclear) [Tetrahymena thermophila SB210]|uniref:Uncharacterized protein n=1 Tax=Tetrahymena thermophila (strain SB210) TaxID=312017 RepID=I7MAW6_TETTS|nr:hypothetical protein TTHERM_00328640 [Tetrahymena thermophila SB210]EAS06283.2 hypothetical protein TTHERM_00328640 [Tetrahymena thermophila SB210]|eukprot:XP_001026528.2 hypothetical protein TTHERM_00328640 [Tetrahymena thermophila SB210]